MGQELTGNTKLSRHWKEPYSIAKAYAIEMHATEGAIILGHYRRDKVTDSIRIGHNRYERVTKHNVLTLLDDCRYTQLDIQPINEWIYFVYVCRFTFVFFSLSEIPNYIQHYSTKILPTRCLRLPHGNHDGRQRRFNRLPLYLRNNSKRPRVVKALRAAFADFQKQEGCVPQTSAGVVD